MKKVYKFLVSLSATSLILTAMVILFKTNGYILNNTSSYPIGIYKITKKDLYNKGTLVSFCAPQNNTIKKLVEYGFAASNATCKNGTPILLKKLVALEGDKITIINNHVYINTILQPKSKIFFVGRSGNYLERQNSQIINKGNFWAMSDYNERSYDSRYYGQVSLDNIKGAAMPVLTW